ncbi:MAG: trehalose-phosphatase, partial [Thermoleophilia bacterium]|nr:trehalose-phosphatase [Thermoleophilia bacterium]
VIEHKTASVAVHYRLVEPALQAVVEQRVRETAAHYPNLRVGTGKMVLELRLNLPWDKGRAALWLLEQLGTKSNPEQKLCPVALGDDITDEDMFASLAERGITICVGLQSRLTRAEYHLPGVEQVADFLKLFLPSQRGQQSST